MQSEHQAKVLITNFSRLVSRFLKDEKGVTAIEFAIVSVPFFILLFGLLEVCYVFVLSTSLDHGLAEAARRLRTGELQATGASESSFKTMVCDNSMSFLDCNNLSVDVQVVSSFRAAPNNNPITENGLDTSGLSFDGGQGSEIMIARIYYKREIWTPIIGRALANAGNNQLVVQSNLAFRNEPF